MSGNTAHFWKAYIGTKIITKNRVAITARSVDAGCFRPSSLKELSALLNWCNYKKN
tara:strand:- start:5830 stop:5997 length:168 start_codon:yes stop_codon:yes gene_type:complete